VREEETHRGGRDALPRFVVGDVACITQNGLPQREEVARRCSAKPAAPEPTELMLATGRSTSGRVMHGKVGVYLACPASARQVMPGLFVNGERHFSWGTYSCMCVMITPHSPPTQLSA
jgi:hypothetical protein